MAFDNLCKLLAEKHPEPFATWILGQPILMAQVLKSELSIEPIRADSVTFLQLQGSILHLEFQVKLDSEPPLPLRLLDYWVRLYRLYRVPIERVLVLLRPPAEAFEIETAFVFGTTRHEYRVVKMWEQDPEIFLQDLSLLPLATLAATTHPEQLLNRIAQRLSRIDSAAQRREVSAYTQVLAGLRFEKRLIETVFQEGIMRESVIYQEILQEGERKGRQEGELTLVMRLITHRFGQISPAIAAQIGTLSLAELENLGEALFDFSSLSELEAWLRSHQ
jgi:predicted transposase/invertase (TIGR01784 family)